VRLVGAAENGGRVDGRPIAPGVEASAEERKVPVDLRIVLVAAGDRLAGTTFWGAKQYDRLASFPWGLEQTVRWGWLGFLARPLLRALQWIHANLTPNYGWAIVLLTVALKVVLLPLSIAGFRSMRKMQKLAPKMQAIRERYRPKLRDKQGRFNADMQRQMNEEVMALYRTEGVNPAGGCLPILVQLPIFFAFYQLLSTAVELWRSPWALWIHDLTAPDSYWALPIVMGVTQLIQTKMTPPPPDPVQKRLIQAMPIVFTVFSLGFPSGLVLYWLTNNVLSIAQQGVYNRIRERAEEREAAEPANAGKRGKKRP
jgi:YidC/Oxa1 family membrane protein insertase